MTVKFKRECALVAPTQKAESTQGGWSECFVILPDGEVVIGAYAGSELARIEHRLIPDKKVVQLSELFSNNPFGNDAVVTKRSKNYSHTAGVFAKAGKLGIH